ncbi:ricin-type beta-trefoil lectin domain protein [Actinoallomurus sp. NPDC050550]|uniref:ricin-type beta-trefoil lectin domain protein n=1 Tax=Actinoallomurus sp. NPDC050550 TaxID=3154937 RepID=UPI0033FAB84D
MKRTIIGAAALALTGLIVGGTPAQAASYVSYKNDATHTCLTGNQKNNKASLARCTKSSYQKWTRLTYSSHGGHTIRNQKTGRCLSFTASADYQKPLHVLTRKCDSHQGCLYWSMSAIHGKNIGPATDICGMGYLHSASKGAVYVAGSSTSAQRSWTWR